MRDFVGPVLRDGLEAAEVVLVVDLVTSLEPSVARVDLGLAQEIDVTAAKRMKDLPTVSLDAGLLEQPLHV